MSKPRVTTDEQDKLNAEWWWALKQAGTVRGKAAELGISIPALYDSIKRGLGQDDHNLRYKLRDVPRESIHSESIAEVAR
jgi:hypothetical protein